MGVSSICVYVYTDPNHSELQKLLENSATKNSSGTNVHNNICQHTIDIRADESSSIVDLESPSISEQLQSDGDGDDNSDDDYYDDDDENGDVADDSFFSMTHSPNHHTLPYTFPNSTIYFPQEPFDFNRTKYDPDQLNIYPPPSYTKNPFENKSRLQEFELNMSKL